MKHTGSAAAALLIALVSVAATGCGTSATAASSPAPSKASTAPSLGTVSGTVRMYGGALNPRTGRMSLNGNPAASVAPVVVKQGARVVVRSKTSSAGRYAVRLPAGNYTISAGCSRPVNLVVKAGAAVTRDLPCFVP